MSLVHLSTSLHDLLKNKPESFYSLFSEEVDLSSEIIFEKPCPGCGASDLEDWPSNCAWCGYDFKMCAHKGAVDLVIQNLYDMPPQESLEAVAQMVCNVLEAFA